MQLLGRYQDLNDTVFFDRNSSSQMLHSKHRLERVAAVKLQRNGAVTSRAV